MDSLDLKTRLPPRKRLLAGLKKENHCPEFHLPASKVFARLRDLINSTTSSPDEIFEASKSASLAAAETAAAARALAMEKAAAAAKAKASAKNALEVLASILEIEDCDKDAITNKPKSRKKHVPAKLLYKSNRPVGRHATDEELARRLHRSMNSSPRILSNASKKPWSHVNLLNFCSENAQSSRNLVVKIEEKVVVNLQALSLDEEEDIAISQEKHRRSRTNGISSGNKVKVKQKKLPLNQCSTKGQRESREPLASDVHLSNGEQKLDFAANVIAADAKASREGEVSMKITSMLKCKKIKVSQSSSDAKALHTLCPKPTAAKTSATMPAD